MLDSGKSKVFFFLGNSVTPIAVMERSAEDY